MRPPPTAAAAAPAATGGASNPLIPSAISSGCQSFLTALNSDEAIATCTTPLLTTVDAFHASSASVHATAFGSSASQIQSALTDLCSAPGCDDGLLRSLLGQFNGNCSAELQARNQVVLGSYDALYVLSPLRNAVCARDESGGFCADDIAHRTMPKSSTGSNATSVDPSVAASNSAAAAASPSAAASVNASSSGSASVASANATTSATALPALKSNFAVLAASQSDYSIPIPAPPSLYIQITGAARRLLRRQWASGSGSSAAAASSTGSAASASASGAPEATTAADSGVHAFDLPSILPDAQTWSASNLPFLFLSPNMSSSVLCSSCTKTVLSSYVAWESRMPYALGLANSPLLSRQGDLWTGLGQVCGSGFLQAVTQQAGEANLTGGALAGVSRVGAATVVGLASVAALVLAF